LPEDPLSLSIARRSGIAALVLLLAPALLLHAPTTVHAASSASISVTPSVQKYALDCEAAALQIALSGVGIHVTQDRLLGQFGADLRPPVMSNGSPVRWGDPYQTFVGHVNGNFVVTGYGVYYPPIVNAAIADGAGATGGEGWQPAQLWAAVAAGNPVVVLVPHLLRPATVEYWTAWDGRQVWYSHSDHAQVVVGFDSNAGTVTLADPADGLIHTYSMAAFESAWALFHSQAIEVTSGGSSATEAVSPTNGSVNVAVTGPNHSLYFYWNVGGRWYGPLGIGSANSAFSAPAIAAESDGNFDIAVEGPENSLDMYWDISGRWFGPLGVGGIGSTYSTPSIAIDQNGRVTVAVEGPANSTHLFWCVGGTWSGPANLAAPNSTFSAPDLSLVGTGSQGLQVAVQSGDAALQQYKQNGDGSWTGPNAWSGVGTDYSAASSSSTAILYQGTGNSLDASNGGTSTAQVGGGGSAFSSPAVAVSGSSTYAAVQGPGHSLLVYADHGGWSGPVTAGAAGTVYSAPSIAVEANGNLDITAEGPWDTLNFFWRIGTTWYGPLGIGRPGLAFSSLP
jgi:uncharacterized protein YvpB